MRLFRLLLLLVPARSHIRAGLLNTVPSELPPELDHGPRREDILRQQDSLTELQAGRAASEP